MNGKLIVSVIVAAVVFGGGGYYFGMQASGAQTPTRGAGTFAGRTGGAGRLAGGGATFGTIVAVNPTSITIQLATGTPTSTATASGSTLVLYDTATQISKTVAGSATDLTVGQSVTVAGTANSDGSITASSIQVRPAGAGRPAGTAGTAPATSGQ